jgi:hypothetical protein
LFACRKEEIITSPALAEALGVRWAMKMLLEVIIQHVIIIASDAITVVKELMVVLARMK